MKKLKGDGQAVDDMKRAWGHLGFSRNAVTGGEGSKTLNLHVASGTEGTISAAWKTAAKSPVVTNLGRLQKIKRSRKKARRGDVDPTQAEGWEEQRKSATRRWFIQEKVSWRE